MWPECSAVACIVLERCDEMMYCHQGEGDIEKSKDIARSKSGALVAKEHQGTGAVVMRAQQQAATPAMSWMGLASEGS